MTNLPILSLITFTPLVGAVVIGLLPDRRDDLVRRVALLFALLAWLFSIGLVLSFAFGGAQQAACPNGARCPASPESGSSDTPRRSTGSPTSASSTRSAPTGCPCSWSC